MQKQKYFKRESIKQKKRKLKMLFILIDYGKIVQL